MKDDFTYMEAHEIGVGAMRDRAKNGNRTGTGLSREVSVVLDTSRIVAALLVFVGHCNGLIGNPFGKLGHHAEDAVAIFFVLSGFVIAYVAMTREQSAMAYARARFVRVYSVAIPAIVVTILADAIGSHHDLAAYAGHSPDLHGLVAGIVACLTFSGEFWSNHIYLGTNEPYWSINFEIWYYALLGVALFLRPALALMAICLILLVVGPTVASYAPLWLLGAATYRLSVEMRFEMGQTRRFICAVGALVAATAVYAAAKDFTPPTQAIYHFVSFGWESLSNIAFYTGTGVAFALAIIAVIIAAPLLTVLARAIEHPVRWLAGATFTLYLVHLPIVYCLYAFTYRETSIVRAVAIMGGTLAIVLLLAEIGERRKKAWERILMFIPRLVMQRRVVAAAASKG